jgi:LysM domain
MGLVCFLLPMLVFSRVFDQNYQPINSGYPAATAQSYAVRDGDTLRAIAQAVWGDADLWWMIAEANGLVGTERLTGGMNLIIPNKVTNIYNNSGTFKVYDAGEAIGATSPNLPDAPKKKCNAFVALFAVVLAAIVFPAALQGMGALFAGSGLPTAVTTAVSYAAAGAAVITVSQAVNVIGGNQDKN